MGEVNAPFHAVSRVMTLGELTFHGAVDRLITLTAASIV